MRIRGDYIASAAVALMLLISFILTQGITYKEELIKYSSAEWLINDDKSMAMYSMKEVPRNVSKVSLLKYFMTNVGLYGEKLLVTYDRPIEVVRVEERSVQYKVRAIVIFVRYKEDGVTNIVLGPLTREKADIYMVTTVILNETEIHMVVLGIVVNSSEIVEVKGCVMSGNKYIPHAKLDVFIYKMEGERNITEVNIDEVLNKGVPLYEVLTDHSGKFRIRILSSVVPEKYIIAVIASKEENGYIILENKPGTSVDIILRR